MTSEVGSGQVAIFPTFKGFRKAVSVEVDGTTKASTSSFTKGFRSAGGTAGKGFNDAFKSAAGGVGSATLNQLTAAVSKASASLSTARLREQDATGKVRIAEAALAEARSKGASDSAKVVAAEERLASAQRASASATGTATSATTRLSSAQAALRQATAAASSEAVRTGSRFAGLSGVFGSAGSEGASKFSQGFKDVLGGALGANILTGIGFTIGRTINSGISSALQYGFTAIGLASDLSETTSAIRQVYGDAADDIIKYTDTANKSLGQTREQALGAAQTFGVFAKQAGLTGRPLAKFSTRLVSLSADLASFYNTSPADAIEAISAGLRGESEPLRRYGVLLDDATLRQKAQTLGIYKGSDALTGQQRILAAQAVIFDQTGIAQGDFARTSDGLANQQRILAASLEETQTKLGTALYPAFTKIVTYANSTLLPKFSGIIEAVGPRLSKALTDAGPSVDALLTKVGPLVDKFSVWASVKGIPAVIDYMSRFADAAPGWAKKIKELVGPDFAKGGIFDPDGPAHFFDASKNKQLYDVFNIPDIVNNGSIGSKAITDNLGKLNSDTLIQLQNFKGKFDDLPNAIRTRLLTTAVQQGLGADQIANGLATLNSKQLVYLAAFKGSFADLPAQIRNSLSNAPTALTPAGEALMNGLKAGIDKKAADVATSAVLAAANAVRAVKHAQGIASPSKL